MRPTFEHIEDARASHGTFQSQSGDHYGLFTFKSNRGHGVFCIVDDGAQTGWEHVSVSVRRAFGSRDNIMPDWDVMKFVKDTFWGDDETVLQFHPKRDEYVNIHTNVLHLWKQVGVDAPLPSKEMV